MNKHKITLYLKNTLLPGLLFSLITGFFTGLIVVLYKFAVNNVLEYSSQIYSFMRVNPLLLPLAITFVALIALIEKVIYAYAPDAQGGRISNAIIYVRGILTFKWLRTLIWALITSLFTFFIGTPLDNDGPCVLAGTAIGRGVVSSFGSKYRAWDRYMMTGGACAGFATATGAPISGILFSVEEAHHRMSPTILIVAGASVCFSLITASQIAPALGVSLTLFGSLAPITLQYNELWIPLIIGIFCGFFAVAFIKFFKKQHDILTKKIKKINLSITVLVIFVITVIAGFFSPRFIGTGHHLIEELLHDPTTPLYMLALIIIVRYLLTSSSSSAGITGGTFIPTLAFGALISACIANLLIILNLIDQSYYQVILLLGMAACFSGAMKTPLTAIVFAIEALTLRTNVLSVCLTCLVSFIISEIFSPKSINDEIMEIKIEEEHEGKQPKLVDAVVTVHEKSFVVGKLIREVFWPNNLFVLSIKKCNEAAQVDEQGEKTIYPGDKLHVRYSTYDENLTHDELVALVGDGEFLQTEWKENI